MGEICATVCISALWLIRRSWVWGSVHLLDAISLQIPQGMGALSFWNIVRLAKDTRQHLLRSLPIIEREPYLYPWHNKEKWV